MTPWEIDITQMQIIPLFLLPGVHVTEDIPAEIEIFRERVRAIATSDIFLHEQLTRCRRSVLSSSTVRADGPKNTFYNRSLQSLA